MKIKNCMEQFVIERINDIMLKDNKICKCEQCKTDIALLALNSLKPYYVSTEKGDTYTRLSLYEKNSEIDMLCAVAKAIAVVGANPRHE